MEQLLDVKLMETFEDEQIQSFYMHFKENYQTYEEQNADVVSTLFDLTDFQKFKASMLMYKKADGGFK